MVPIPRAVPIAWRFVSHERLRFAVTATGVGVAVLLAVFLAALYDGIRSEANGYVAGRPADIWIAQNNTRLLIRSLSFVRIDRLDSVRATPGVRAASPILRVVTTLAASGGEETVFVMGIEPGDALTAPELDAGRQPAQTGEIVLDRALARRFHLRPGDHVRVQGRDFRVTGTSRGTNTVLTQLAFVPLTDAQDLLGFTSIVSFILVRGEDGIAAATLRDRLAERIRRVNVFTQAEFTATNSRELSVGLLPTLATVAVFGSAIGISVLTLMLYGSVLERREDFALLKALGASHRQVGGLVLRQSLLIVLVGVALGVGGYFVCSPIVVGAVPQLALALTPRVLLVSFGAALAMGVLASQLPLRRLRRIYPGEAFRP